MRPWRRLMSCRIGYASIPAEVRSCGFRPETFCLAAGCAAEDAKAADSHRLLGITGIITTRNSIALANGCFIIFISVTKKEEAGHRQRRILLLKRRNYQLLSSIAR